MNFALDRIRTHDSCIRGKRLTARPQGPHGREQTTPRLILKYSYLEIISPQRHPPETIWRDQIEKIWTALANRVNSRWFPYANSGVSSLCQMVSGGCLCAEIMSRYFNISLGVVCSLPWGPCGLAVRRLPRMHESWVRIPPKAKFIFHNLLHLWGGMGKIILEKLI